MGEDSINTLLEHSQRRPPMAAIVLGSGLNSITDDWPQLCSVPFSRIPRMSGTTVAGHKGELSLHDAGDRSVLVFRGRLHYYEGHSWDAVARPVQFSRELGVRRLILTNASGGIGAKQDAGTLMLIDDHIAANRPHWWCGPGPGGLGPARRSPYSHALNDLIREAARTAALDLCQGVYACVTGPNYETPAEVRALRALGADAVGMSTAHEAEVAAGLGMEVAAVSCVANRAAGLSATPLSHSEVLAMVRSAAGGMRSLLSAAVKLMAG
jgi:purine-nucleoside phosphorylase